MAMPAAIIVSFVILFVLVLLAVSVGMKFFDARRKKQVGRHAADGVGRARGHHHQPAEGNRARSAAPASAGCSRAFQFTKHAQEQIQQAGLTWSPTRMIVRHGAGDHSGVGNRRDGCRFCSTGP